MVVDDCHRRGEAVLQPFPRTPVISAIDKDSRVILRHREDLIGTIKTHTVEEKT